MDPDQHPSRRVPAPREGGRERGADGGDAWCPSIPGPRVAPDLERLPGGVATSTERPVPSTALLPAPGHSTARTVSGAGALRTWRRAVARAVHAALDRVRTLLGALVPSPTAR